MENTIKLSPKKILNKQFKTSHKGYDSSEVDYFLDLVVLDYETFAAMLNQAYDEIKTLKKDKEALTDQVKDLQRELQYEKRAANRLEEDMSSNVDLLKRLSQLEKEVYNKK